MSVDHQDLPVFEDDDARLCEDLFPEISVDWDNNNNEIMDRELVTIMDSSQSSCDDSISSSQHILKSMETTNSFSFSLEPRPIDICSMKVVSQVDLTASSSHGMIHEALFSNLSEILSETKEQREDPLLPDEQQSYVNSKPDAPKQEVPSTLSFPPPLSRQSLRSISASSNNSSSSNENKTSSDRWYERFEDLKVFFQTHGHCHVPINYTPNLPLSKWTKRQRYQMKLKQDGKPSSMSEERQQLLEDMGFLWDVRNSVWDTRYRELVHFHKMNGHCNVSISYDEYPKLGTWVKCQRRQYQLMMLGQKSHMTQVRIQLLNDLHFLWKGKLPARKNH
ncbi:MAG: hypothetical protein SGILL_003578 [Bacillariaceae sp.]